MGTLVSRAKMGLIGRLQNTERPCMQWLWSLSLAGRGMSETMYHNLCVTSPDIAGQKENLIFCVS